LIIDSGPDFETIQDEKDLQGRMANAFISVHERMVVDD
jgi:hypothetical protein